MIEGIVEQHKVYGMIYLCIPYLVKHSNFMFIFMICCRAECTSLLYVVYAIFSVPATFMIYKRVLSVPLLLAMVKIFWDYVMIMIIMGGCTQFPASNIFISYVWTDNLLITSIHFSI